MYNPRWRLGAWLGLIATVIVLLVVFTGYRINKQDTQAVKAMSWVVAGRNFVIDPGHGGEDPGKVSPSGIYEKDINLAVAQKLYVLLQNGGGRVTMTRDKDAALSSNESSVRERKIADLKNRVGLAQTAGADLYIALHCNSFPQGKWRGAQTFYAPSIAGSKELATFIQDELVAYLGNTTRKPKTDTSSIIFKELKVPIVNIEMGFLSNPQEEELLQNPAYQDKIAWAIYSGIVRYLVEYSDQYKPTFTTKVK